MVHERQRLPLRLEAGDDLCCVHASLDHLQRDLPVNWPGLLGKPDLTHSAFARELQEAVGTEVSLDDAVAWDTL